MLNVVLIDTMDPGNAPMVTCKLMQDDPWELIVHPLGCSRLPMVLCSFVPVVLTEVPFSFPWYVTRCHNYPNSGLVIIVPWEHSWRYHVITGYSRLLEGLS